MKIEITIDLTNDDIHCLDTGNITITSGDKAISSVHDTPRCSMMVFFFLGRLLYELTDLRAAKNMRKFQVGTSDFPFLISMQKIGSRVIVSSSDVSFDFDFDEFCEEVYASIKAFLFEWDPIIDPDDRMIKDLRRSVGEFYRSKGSKAGRPL